MTCMTQRENIFILLHNKNHTVNYTGGDYFLVVVVSGYNTDNNIKFRWKTSKFYVAYLWKDELPHPQ